jgi:1-phosphatidylinositol-4-phosphate 5-kinase
MGKSGSFMFFSHDNKFLIKTVKEGEIAVLKKFLMPYYQHLKRHPNSLLAKIYGFYSINIQYFSFPKGLYSFN